MLKIDLNVKGDPNRFRKFDFIPPIERGMKKALIDVAGHIQKYKLSGQLLRVRTGALRRSIRSAVRARGDRVHGTVGSRVPYARIQELGGTVRPKKGRYLTIPTEFAKTAAGVTRGGARSFPDTFIQRSRRGNLLIFQKRGDEIVPLFVLVRSVTIRPKHYLRKGFEDKLGDIARHIKTEIRKAI